VSASALPTLAVTDELEELVGRPVDLLTLRMLSRWLRPQVMREARLLDDAA
jgi:predicted nucleotidyltransferase